MILTDAYFEEYKKALAANISVALQQIEEIELDEQSFRFYTSVAVISSSRIEGEQLDIDSYLKHTTQNIGYLPQLVQKPDDLYQAYIFAKQHKLSSEHFLAAHRLLTQHLLPTDQRGVYRKNPMLVMEHKTGRIQFEAAPHQMVATEMDKFWADIENLLKNRLDNEAVFYYAALIHLVFVNIHPFNDGNGRAARLLEKWFLAQKLGERAWYIKSEKYYYHHVDAYYKNLNQLGLFYETLDYTKASNFLQMLPHAINYKG